MSSPIDRVGTFRGTPTEWGLSKSSGGFPQLALKVRAKEMYISDPTQFETFGLTEAGWVDWSTYDQEGIGYLVLFNAEKALLNFEQAQKAFGWDGADLAALHTGPWGEKDILFSMEENTYKDATTIRLNWIDAYDASPVRGLTNLDADGIAALQGQFAHMLNGKAKAAPVKAPAKAPAKAATPAGKPAPGAAKPSATTAGTAGTTSTATTTTTPPAAATKAPPKAAAKPPAAAKKEEPAAPFAATCTKEEAWNAVSAKQNGISDDDMATTWIDAYDAAAPGVEEAAATPEHWAAVRDNAIAALAKLAPAAAA